MNRIVVFAIAAAMAAGAVAQDAPAADARPVNVLPDSGPLVKAVKAALGGPSRFTGKVEVKKPEAEEDGMMGMVFGGPPGGGAGEEFAGDVEVMRTDKGESVVASTATLPVLAAYDDGKAMSVHAHYAAGKPPSAARFTKMLLPLLRGDALAKAVEKATWKTEAGEGGATVYVGKLPKSLVEKTDEDVSAGRGMMMMGGGPPKVMDVDARFTVGKDGKLVGASIALKRNDPAAAMRKLFEAKREESDGEGGIAISPEDFENLEDVEGETITFALTRGDDAPSKRAARLLALFRAAGAE